MPVFGGDKGSGRPPYPPCSYLLNKVKLGPLLKGLFHVEHFNEQIISSVLSDSLSTLNIKIDESAQSKLIAYFILLLNKNTLINLISPKQDIKTKVIIHLVDSLTPLIWPDLPICAAKAMDFGSGGGLPAIPLSIARPEWLYTLVESTGKKISFLNEVRESLSLNNIITANKFLEPGKNNENCFYDLITARGVSNLKKLLSIAGPRLNKNGFFIAFKGPQGDFELKNSSGELKKRNMALHDCLTFTLPFLEAERRLFIFQKL